MDSSRVFVRGLPSNLSAEEFRKHFSKLFAVTDAKYIAHRRIGYVGFKTRDEAQKAIKYFNKTFIHMSRIFVELARPVEEQASRSSRVSSTTQARDSYTQERNVSHDRSHTRSSDPKLQEFLQVMQPPSKGKTWENEDMTTNKSTPQTHEANDTVIEESESDGEYQHVAKKRRLSPKLSENTGPVNEVAMEEKDESGNKAEPTSNVINEGQKADPSRIEQTVETVETVAQHTDGNLLPTSDGDWLRSRTSRLLGLVDDDEAIVSPRLPVETVKVMDTIIAQVPQSSETVDVPEAEENGHEDLKQDESEIIAEPKVPRNSTTGTGRLFIRNLSYTVSEEDLKGCFEPYGSLDEVHIPIDFKSGVSKGFAYVQFLDSQKAEIACSELDGKAFQGRLMHILPAVAKNDNTLDEFAVSKLPLKRQKQIRRKNEALSATFQWNSMYMSANAVMSSISNRLGISKSELLDPTSADSAVKQAHAETNVIQETKAFFAANGVNLNAFKKSERGDTAILVKNFAFGTSHEELRYLFETYGSISKLVMPPSGTLAIVEFELPMQAKSAFKSLAYRKFKDSVLFLEKAPKAIFSGKKVGSNSAGVEGQLRIATVDKKPSTTDILDIVTSLGSLDTSTLFVRNLNFTTTTDRLQEVFRPLDGFMSARVKTKPDPKKPGGILSMGFGFLEFRTKQQAQAALGAMNGYKLDGFDLLIKPSQKAMDAAEDRRKEDRAKKVSQRRTKIIIKNLPFEASKKDVRSLFASYGQLRSVRVPKKFDSSTRGFAFADFVTAKEAENTMDALRDTHLLGRKLVLEFAADDALDPEEEIEKMQQKIGKQADKVALQKLTSHGRKKFSLENEEEHG